MGYPSQRTVTVCDKCLTETCYKGQFPCAERVAGNAADITDTEERIAQLPVVDGVVLEDGEKQCVDGEPVRS